MASSCWREFLCRSKCGCALEKMLPIDHRALAQRALARLIVRLGLASERRAVRAHVGVDLAAAPVAEREDRGAAASGRGRAEVRDARGHHRPVARRVPDLRAERRSCLRKRRGAG